MGIFKAAESIMADADEKAKAEKLAAAKKRVSEPCALKLTEDGHADCFYSRLKH